MYVCGSEFEFTVQFLLLCRLYSPQRLELFGNLEKVDSSFLNLNGKDKVFFFMGLNHQLPKAPKKILRFVINYIKETDRFDRPLFCPSQWLLDFF